MASLMEKRLLTSMRCPPGPHHGEALIRHLSKAPACRRDLPVLNLKKWQSAQSCNRQPPGEKRTEYRPRISIVLPAGAVMQPGFRSLAEAFPAC